MSILEEVAKQAGVSPRTVTRVMRGDTKECWPSAVARAEKIRKIARELGYRPNSSASAIRKGRFDCLGLLLSADEGRSNLPPLLLDGIHDELLKRQMHLTLAKLPDQDLVEQGAFPRILQECCCDGLLVNYTDRIPFAMLKRLDEDPVPSMWLNCKLKQDCIHYDDFQAGIDATKQLIELGHRQIAYLDFTQFHVQPDSHYSRVDRHAGYVQTMTQAGLTPTPRQQFSGIQGKARLNALLQLLQSPNRPTAIISYDAEHRVLLAAAMSGLSVPRDLSLISFDEQNPAGATDEQGENYIGIDISKMRIPTMLAGQRAVELLIEKIEHTNKVIEPCVLPLTLDAGQTLARAIDPS
jgi:LacI family transcriptional regulator